MVLGWMDWIGRVGRWTDGRNVRVVRSGRRNVETRHALSLRYDRVHRVIRVHHVPRHKKHPISI